MRSFGQAAVLLATLAFALPALADGKVLNLYTARHYQTDEALYENFTKATGIAIRRIEGKEDEIIERIRQEGANSPADVLLTVDVGRLWRAQQAALLQPVQSEILASRIPPQLREPEGYWYGFSQRARVIFYSKARVPAGAINTYEDLVDARWRGKLCVRSGSHVYQLSLLGGLIAAIGEAKAEEWAKGAVANFAREPQGGDIDQIKGIASGECDLALGNTYYFMRLMLSGKPGELAIADKVGVLFPNQGDRGTHINISGGGVVKTAPNREAAIRFLEYLASDEAQRHLADGNNEYPAVPSARTDNPALAKLGPFKADSGNVAALGRNQAAAQRIYDKVGWK